MRNVHGIVDESCQSPWASFQQEFGNLQEHKIREHRQCVRHHSQINTRTSEEILNVRSLDHSSPSWTRSTLFNNKAIKWAKAKVCVYADSVLCVGRIEQAPGTADATCIRQIEDLTMYFSYQDASGLDGEAIEFEWKIFPGFTTIIDYSSGDPERHGGEEHQAGELQGPDPLHLIVQQHSVEIR